jgi:hypothetical protein
MRTLSIIFLALLLTACSLVRSNQVANMDAEQLHSVNDDDLCLSGTSSNRAVIAERQRRGLGDCSKAHRECKAMGYMRGTELYLQCRAMQAQLAAQKEAQEKADREALGDAMIAIGTSMMSQNGNR